ncbi:hypothetical protein J3Q64DRAFT_1862634 [Phycomyces blakesleeanus]|uniref:Uncharacterized protein n=1 Tax=Phycomyces blakesleeanus TaxID=4837 RepID=A0ABR3AZT0_PHYBL
MLPDISTYFIRKTEDISQQLSKGCINKEIGWGVWKYLESLDIQFDKTDGLAAKNNIFATFSHLPRLINLKTGKCIEMQLIPFTMEDMDFIHQTVEMRLFHINTDLIDYKWVGYFACKYPYLRMWNSYSHKSCADVNITAGDSDCNQQTRHFISLIRQSIDVFKLLETVHTHCKNCFQGNPFTFWEFLDPKTTPLKTIKCLVDEYNGLGSQIEFFENYVNPFSGTLKKIDIILNTDTKDISNHLSFSKIINVFPSLTKANINFSGATLDIAIVLDNCLTLKSLKVSSCMISTELNQFRLSSSHGLRFLHAYHSKVTTNVLHYISLRCRRLNYMKLDTTEIIGAIVPTTGDMRINMAYSHFTALCLCNVCFTSNKCSQRDDSKVELFLLSWSKSGK